MNYDTRGGLILCVQELTPLLDRSTTGQTELQTSTYTPWCLYVLSPSVSLCRDETSEKAL